MNKSQSLEKSAELLHNKKAFFSIKYFERSEKLILQFYNNFQDILKIMQGNSYQFRAASWKNSIAKPNTAESRILTDSKQLPSKFSPARNADVSGSNTSKSLVKSKILSRSHDQIALRDLKDSSVSKDKNIQKRQITENTVQMGNNFKTVQSQQSINYKHESPLRRKQSRKSQFVSQNVDFIKDIKLEYIRFKQRVLNQLKKQQELIKKAIQQIMSIVSRSVNTKISTFVSQSKTLPNAAQVPTFNSPVNFSNNLPKITIPAHMTIDTAKYRESLVNDKIQIESVVPKIKEKVNNMFDLMAQLKNQINQQTFHPLSLAQSDVVEVQ